MAQNKTDSVLLKVEHLKKYFSVPAGMLHAVDDVSFEIKEGNTLGVVGESGCGKSTMGRTILRLHEPTEGNVFFEGRDITALGKNEMKHMRKDMQLIFQDPFASLNPRMTVSQALLEPLLIQGIYKSEKDPDAQQKVQETMEMVGLTKRLVNSYPHELDGGRRQRIGIGRALILNTKFIVCDEPVSALDVSIQAQILNLMQDLQKQLQLTYMFITHDLSVVKHFSDEIAVMYLGQIVEKCESKRIFKNPAHPYTRALLSAIPIPDPTIKMEQILLEGELASPINPEPGCRFAKRCPYAKPECSGSEIPTVEVEKNHFVKCLLAKKEIKD